MTEIDKVTELKMLKEKADMMGVSYSPNIGIDKLRDKINEKLNPVVEVKEQTEPKEETEIQMKMRLRKEMTKLVRCQVSCMDPSRKGWRGELFTVGNSLTGSITKFIPFDAPNGWHIPLIILNAMRERVYQHHYKVKIDGKEVNKQRAMPAFGIVELSPLTIDELETINERQSIKTEEI